VIYRAAMAPKGRAVALLVTVHTDFMGKPGLSARSVRYVVLTGAIRILVNRGPASS